MTRHLVTGARGSSARTSPGDRLRTAARGADGICRLAAGTGSATLRQILGPDIIKLDAFLTRGIDGVPMRCALAAGLVPFAAGIGATPTACDPSLTAPAISGADTAASDTVLTMERSTMKRRCDAVGGRHV